MDFSGRAEESPSLVASLYRIFEPGGFSIVQRLHYSETQQQ